MIGFDGLEASQDAKRLIREFGVGHIILFWRATLRPEQVAGLLRSSRRRPAICRHDTPLLGRSGSGRGPRGPHGPLDGRPPCARWAASAPKTSHADGRGPGRSAPRPAQVRFRADHGRRHEPDNPIIGNRSFGDDPELVGRLGAAMIEGLQAGESWLRPSTSRGTATRTSIPTRAAGGRAEPQPNVEIALSGAPLPEGCDDHEWPTSSTRARSEFPRRSPSRSSRHPAAAASSTTAWCSRTTRDEGVADRWAHRSLRRPRPPAATSSPCANSHDAQSPPWRGRPAAEAGDVPFQAMDDSLRRIRSLKERYSCLSRSRSARARRRADREFTPSPGDSERGGDRSGSVDLGLKGRAAAVAGASRVGPRDAHALAAEGCSVRCAAATRHGCAKRRNRSARHRRAHAGP